MFRCVFSVKKKREKTVFSSGFGWLFFFFFSVGDF